MTEAFVVGMGRQALWMVLMIGGPMLVVALLTGFIVSIFQATTQINEQTLTFAPKILAVLVTGALLGPWMLETLVSYTTELLATMPNFVR